MGGEVCSIFGFAAYLPPTVILRPSLFSPHQKISAGGAQPLQALASCCSADFATVDQRVDAAGRQSLADLAHALAQRRAADRMRGAELEVVVRAGILDAIGDGESAASA